MSEVLSPAGGPTVFGPVPSRRLGRSLGVSTIPPKTCSYSCAYCQIGRTTCCLIEPQLFYDPEEVRESVHARLADLRSRQEPVDYVSLVPDGEPTLDRNLGRCISLLRSLGVPVAVISNASLLWREEVRAQLAQADWVSLKVDAVHERTWHTLDHPHRGLKLAALLRGVLQFGGEYKGRLVTETMMVAGYNDGEEDVRALAEFMRGLKPAIAYLSLPTRPPADASVRPATEATVARAHALITRYGQPVELLTGSEGDAFSSTGNAIRDLLSITSVHPMRRGSVEVLLEKCGSGWDTVGRLLDEGLLVRTEYAGETYYLRSFCRRREGATTEQGGS